MAASQSSVCFWLFFVSFIGKSSFSLFSFMIKEDVTGVDSQVMVCGFGISRGEKGSFTIRRISV